MPTQTRDRSSLPGPQRAFSSLTALLSMARSRNRERCSHTHTRTHACTHTRTHVHTHGILATVLPSFSGNRKGCRLLVQNTQNTGSAATFCQKRASLGCRVGEAVRVGTVRACSGTAPGMTTRARLLFASSGTCRTAFRGKVVFKKTERKEKRHNHRHMKEETSTGA